MKEEIRTRWLEALRSRSYIQDGNWLHIKKRAMKRFSALGVLTDLYLTDREKNWNYIPEQPTCDDADEIIYVGLSSSRQAAVNNEIMKGLSPQVMRWAGIEDLYVEIPTLGEFRNNRRKRILDAGGTIRGLDDYGFSFGEIAEIIEITL